MKWTSFWLLIMIMVLSGCGKKEWDETSNDIKLNLMNQDSIQVWCRSVSSFDAIDKNQTYTAKSSNPSILTVEVQNGSFVVRAKEPGTADIVINNEFGKSKTVKCRSCSFSGLWCDLSILSQIYQNALMVNVDDENTKKIIKQELIEWLKNQEYKYKFVDNSTKVIVQKDKDEASAEYSFGFNVKSQVLALNDERHSYRYFCDIQPPYPNVFSDKPYFIVALKENLTYHYDKIYPFAGVRDVYVIKYLISLDDYWLLNKD